MAALAAAGRPAVLCRLGSQQPSSQPQQKPPTLRFAPSLKLSRHRRRVIANEVDYAERITEELRNSTEIDPTAGGKGAGAVPAVLVTGKVNGVENGRAGNGYAVNGASYVNGATRVNGISPAGYPPVVSEAINGAVVNGAVAVPAGTKTKVDYSTNQTGPAVITSPPPFTASDIELDSLDACEVGQLEACAAQRITESLDAEAAGPGPSSQAVAEAATAAAADSGVRGTPYSAPGGRWSNFKNYSTFQRTWQIWSFAFVFAIKSFALRWKFTYGRKGMTEERKVQRRQKLAGWLREGLIKLGPTFIKIGQQFSTRVDVLSREFIAELEKLQDNVPAFESAQAISIIERNLGTPISQQFDSFDPVPIAAASLGQVHLATLKGERVVVKVQRPGLKSLFDIDLKNIRVLAQWLQKVDPQSDGAARDWVAIYDECSRILYQEIDYTLEGQNADRFRKNFAAKEWIKVPRIDWDHTTSEVLTMEYCPGVKINNAAALDAQGIDRKRLAKLSVECYLEQLLTYGFFHADPHPGNIAVDATGGGRLIYYDFGMMGEIPKDVRSGLLELFYGVYEKDPDRCIGALVTMGVLIPGPDMTAVRRTAAFFLKNFEDRLAQQQKEAKANPDYDANFKGARSKEEKKAVRKQILSNIGEDLLVASADKPFRFPATFTFVVRSFTVLDGIGKSLNPRFDISEIAAPYARGLLLEARPQVAKLAETFRKRVGLQNRAVKNLFTGPNMIEDVAGTMKKLESGDLKLRVRALEAERALGRVQASQKAVTTAIVASTLTNVGVVLSVSAMTTAATAAFGGAALMGLMTLVSLLKIRKQEKKELMITGAA
mmetsp:Transcript_1238/g.3679  ORF Transcript_1238/g.3679 Transcript_1238/m.3679 type:complete len:832 (+) Transcript_1238:121-2616(+)